jgi:hypothetical protein
MTSRGLGSSRPNMTSVNRGMHLHKLIDIFPSAFSPPTTALLPNSAFVSVSVCIVLARGFIAFLCPATVPSLDAERPLQPSFLRISASPHPRASAAGTRLRLRVRAHTAPSCPNETTRSRDLCLLTHPHPPSMSIECRRSSTPSYGLSSVALCRASARLSTTMYDAAHISYASLANDRPARYCWSLPPKSSSPPATATPTPRMPT